MRQITESVANGLLLNRDGRRRQLARKAIFDLAGRVTPVLYSSHDGVAYYVSTRDRVVSRQIFAAGAYDDQVMAEALRLLADLGRPLLGRTFVDVGANIGTSTIPALLRFGARDAVAIEPEPGNFRLLRCNVIANDLDDRVVSVRAAASDRAGTGQLQLSSWNAGDHRVRPGPTAPVGSTADPTTIGIRLERLDDLLAVHVGDLQRIGVVWIDCQGHEGYVLKGAPKLTLSNVPLICEYWPHGLRGADNLELFHELVAKHYRWVVNIGDTNGRLSWIPATEIASLQDAYPEQSFTDLILLNDERPVLGRTHPVDDPAQASSAEEE